MSLYNKNFLEQLNSFQLFVLIEYLFILIAFQSAGPDYEAENKLPHF